MTSFYLLHFQTEILCNLSTEQAARPVSALPPPSPTCLPNNVGRRAKFAKLRIMYFLHYSVTSCFFQTNSLFAFCSQTNVIHFLPMGREQKNVNSEEIKDKSAVIFHFTAFTLPAEFDNVHPEVNVMKTGFKISTVLLRVI